MTHRLATCLVLTLGLLMICSAAFAHHGEAAGYEYSSRITVQATVTEFVWRNPHGQLLVDFKNDMGQVEHWGFELYSPGQMTRLGYTKDTFKPGDVIRISFTPAMNSRPFGNCVYAVRADGLKFHGGQCGLPGGDLTKLPVKAGYTSVEVKIPDDTAGAAPQAQ